MKIDTTLGEFKTVKEIHEEAPHRSLLVFVSTETRNQLEVQLGYVVTAKSLRLLIEAIANGEVKLITERR